MRVVLLIIFFIHHLIVCATKPEFERITNANGLSQNNIIAIHQDSDGYMWFGTYDGLNRYDGYEFIVYRTSNDENSITSNLINSIVEDKNGNLWIGLFDDGVCKFNKSTETFTRFRNTPANPQLLTNNIAKSLMCDSKNNIWICTTKGINCLTENPDGTYRILQIENIKNDSNSLLHNNIQRITEDSKGNIWVSSQYNLELMRFGEDNTIQNSFYHLLTDKLYDDIGKIQEVSQGYIVSYQKGLLELKFNPDFPEKSEIIQLEDHASNTFIKDFEGNIWSGGHSGIYLFKPTQDTNNPYILTQHFIEGAEKSSLSNQFIRSMFFDNAGILWIGTNGGGILKYNTQRYRFRIYQKSKKPGSLSHNKVWCTYQDKRQNIWIGTEGGGINFLDKKKQKKYETGFISFDVNIPGEQNFAFDIIDISSGESHELMAGVGYNSLAVNIKKEDNKWTASEAFPELTQQIMTLLEDEFGTIWLGSYFGGLAKYTSDATKNNLQIYTPDNSKLHTDIIRNLFEDSKGRLWIGTNKGLLLLTREQKKNNILDFTLFTNNPEDPSSISSSYTVPIIETSTNEIWIGTFGAGINKYIEGSTLTNGTFVATTVEDGLPNNTIKQIIEDNNGNLWITSNKGLSRLEPKNGKIRNFTVHDGLQDMEFIDLSGCKLSDGEILIGGVNGFNAFYPENIKVDSVPPNIVFNRLEVMNKEIRINDMIDGKVVLEKTLNLVKNITLNHTHNSFKIHFAAIQYTAPEAARFKYMLDGFDDSWISTNYESLFANYTNIPAGNYTFKVLAANSDGFWTKEPKELSIEIKPPFWLTLWFRTTFPAVILVIISTVIWFRFYLIRARNKKLQIEIDKRTEQLRNSNTMLNETNTQLEERQQVIEEQAEELRAQRDTLEETNATKDKFYSILAHDLKGPFNSLLGYLELLHHNYDRFDNKIRKNRIGQALKSSNVLFRLVENLLQWSRAQRGLIPFNPKETMVVKEIEDIVGIYKDATNNKGVTINYNISNEITKAIIDVDMFRTILRNLISNAIKYTKQGESITINVNNIDKDLVVKVTDTGIGIPKEAIGTILRVDSKYTTEGTNHEKGTGLGLVLCKEFVDIHHGNIGIESKEGKGTTVSFTLPLTPLMD